jgi:hypothetical protein
VVPATLNGQRGAAKEGSRAVGSIGEVAMTKRREVLLTIPATSET